MLLSVIIAAMSPDPRVLARCLGGLEAERPGDMEVIVCRADNGLPPPSAVRLVTAPSDSGFNHLRALGLRAARGKVAMILSEDYQLAPGWAQQAAAAPDDRVTCGEVLPPPQPSTHDMAAYLWEYAHLAPPAPAGPLSRAQARMIPAGLTLYRRASLRPDLIAAAPSEMDYHQALFDLGIGFVRNPKLAAVYQPPADFGSARRCWSRSWARPRAERLSSAQRRFTALSRAALPPLLLARFAARVASKPRYWFAAAGAAPHLAAFAWAQAAGEISAYWPDPAQR